MGCDILFLGFKYYLFVLEVQFLKDTNIHKHTQHTVIQSHTVYNQSGRPVFILVRCELCSSLSLNITFRGPYSIAMRHDIFNSVAVLYTPRQGVAYMIGRL